MVCCWPCSSRSVRLVAFDFDNTLATMHVFKILSGWEVNDHIDVKPYASTQLGQVRRISELSKVQPFRRVGGFAAFAFGGGRRIARIRKVLEALQERDVEVVVCSRGLVGTIKKILNDLDLLRFFTEVYANADIYDKTPFDVEVSRLPRSNEEMSFCRTEEHNGFEWASKALCISRLMKRLALSRWHEAVLLDDDEGEIIEARTTCRTIFIRRGRGLEEAHLRQLDRLTAVSARAARCIRNGRKLRGRAEIGDYVHTAGLGSKRLSYTKSDSGASIPSSIPSNSLLR